MAKSNLSANNYLREKYIELFTKVLSENGEEVLRTASNKISIPVVDEAGEEKFVVFTVTIPKGANKGADPYDGYSEAEDFEMKQKAKAEAKAEAEEKKQKKIARDEEYRRKQKEAKEKREAE